MDLVALERRVAAVEAAARSSAAQQRAVIHELDRLAEHLVGESAPELQGVKAHVQELISQVAPERHDVVVYAEVYCHAARP
jgi:hypothetical protein